MQYIKGQCYSEFMTYRESIKFFFDGMCANIVLLRKNLDSEFIRQVEEDEIFFQIFLREEIIFLLVKIAGLNWFDVPFSVNIDKDLLEIPNNTNHGYMAKIILAESISGKVFVNRTHGLSHGLSKALFWALKEQILMPLNQMQAKINKVHASFSAEEMARLSLGK